MARAVIEGLVAGIVSGIWLRAMERSPTFNVFADVLNGGFRILGRFVSEQVIIRLDTEAVGTAAYIGVGALLGTAGGAMLGAARRAGWGPAPAGRAGLLGALLTAVWGAGLSVVWAHRGLPAGVGWTMTAAGGVLAAVGGWLGGAAAGRALRPRALAVAAGILPAVVALACAGTLIVAHRGPAAPSGPDVASPARVDTGVKVAILGVDGLDWSIVDRAIAQGRLPNLARLIRSGTRGDLRSIRPPKSPVVWTSVATGVLPSVHGIRDFIVRREGQRIPVTGNLRKVPALWNLAGICGFTTGFTNWYVTWPAEEVAGVMISDRVDFDGLPGRVTPDSLQAAVDSARARVEARDDREIARFTRVEGEFGAWREARWGQVRRAVRILDDVVRHDLVTLETARLLLRDGQPDLTAVYFRGNDNTQHLFWKYRFAEQRSGLLSQALWDDIGDEDVRALAKVIDRYYDFVDRLVGETLALLDPDTAVLVLSDHGFLTSNEQSHWFHANRLLAAAGLAELATSGTGEAVPQRSVVFDEQPPTTDVERVIRPGGRADDADTALARAEELLRAARTDAGDSVFRTVETEHDADGPYLRVVFATDLRGTEATIGEARLPLADFFVSEGHSGNHRMNGVLIAEGPPFRSGARASGRVLDITPTVLDLLGAPVARDMEGVVLTDLLDPEWRREHPVRYVKSYGTIAGGGDAIATEADDRIREELEALGYIQ
jgi:predicted AlkP superfamily phosphohydrolase/phosphomutase